MMDLRAEAIVKNYGQRQVVKGVSLEVKEGEIVGLLGPNGAGKTTTFYSLVGFVRPDAGSIRLAGTEITHMPMYERARLGLGYLPQEPTVFRGLSVDENLRAVMERTTERRVDQDAVIEPLLNEFGLTKLKDQPAWTLSGGEKRRLEIARAMIQKPRIILLDEPFVGIDPITVGELKDMIFKLRERGLGFLITDHNVRETLPIIDRAYLIFDGQILLHGTSQELINNEKAREIYLGKDFKI